MKQMTQILPLLPDVYARQLRGEELGEIEEVRLSVGQPLRLRFARQERELWPVAGRTTVEEVLQRACYQSAYAYNDTIRQGYVTIEGGHRIGICGFGVTDRDTVSTIRSPSSLCIRVAHEVLGCANALIETLDRSTLILGPPGSGKTTLLRDAVRQLSDKLRYRVGLADERGELSATVDAVAGLQVGGRTDVLVNVPKDKALMMLLRTMNPQWLALDEITAPADLSAMEQAVYCGVRLLATAHGEDMEDLRRRPLYQKLLATGVFRQVVLLSRDKSYVIEEVGG